MRRELFYFDFPLLLAVINHDGVDECIPISEIDLLASGGRKCVIIGQADVPAVVIPDKLPSPSFSRFTSSAAAAFHGHGRVRGRPFPPIRYWNDAWLILTSSRTTWPSLRSFLLLPLTLPFLLKFHKFNCQLVP